MWSRPYILVLVLAGAVLPAAATTYCCTDDAGRRTCGDRVPPQCAKRAYQEYNAQGVLSKQHEAPLTTEQRAQRDAEAARKKEEERRAAEEQRRNQALLASYSSVKDIEAKRDRMLVDAHANLKLAREESDMALAEQKKLAEEAEFYKGRPLPAPLKAKMQNNEAEVAHRQALTVERERDIAAIEARFEDERQRYLSLKKPASDAEAR